MGRRRPQTSPAFLVYGYPSHSLEPRAPPAPLLPGPAAPGSRRARSAGWRGPSRARRPHTRPGARLALHRPPAPGRPRAQDRGPPAPAQASPSSERRSTSEQGVRGARREAGGEDEAAGFSELVTRLALEGREEGSRKAEVTETPSTTYLTGLLAPESPPHPAGERPRGSRARAAAAFGAGLLLRGVRGTPGKASRMGSRDPGCTSPGLSRVSKEKLLMVPSLEK